MQEDAKFPLSNITTFFRDATGMPLLKRGLRLSQDVVITILQNSSGRIRISLTDRKSVV